jgi:hypothetical protein
MVAKTNRRTRSAEFRTPDEAVGDDDIERFLKEHHQDVAEKLREARASIARGEVKPLDPLPVLLRKARKRSRRAH